MLYKLKIICLETTTFRVKGDSVELLFVASFCMKIPQNATHFYLSPGELG